MKHAHKTINLLIVAVLLSGLPTRGEEPDVLSASDTPAFSTSGQSIWGPQSVDEKGFDVTLLELVDQGTAEQVLWFDADGTVATFEGDLSLVCAEGDFLDLVSGDCYTCPENYEYDPLKPVDESGVCFQLGHETIADRVDDAEFLCPGGQFPDAGLTGCYSCPAGYEHNPLLPVDVPGVCFDPSFETADRKRDFGCSEDEFPDAGLSGCYTCRSGYQHNPLLTVDTPGVCFQPPYTEERKMKKCGTRSCALRDPIFGVCLDWDYSCSGWQVRDGNNLYKCDSGFTHNIFVPFNQTGICTKLHAGSNRTADYEHAFGCAEGEFPNLELSGCYACPSGYAHNPLLTVNTPGVCFKTDLDTATRQNDITLICGENQFYDVVSNGCYTCPAGYRHDPFLTADDEGVCFERDDEVAELVGDTFFGCPAGQFPDAALTGCYSCPDGLEWNPSVPVHVVGACSDLALVPEGEGNFRAGLTTDYDWDIKVGLEGGILSDPGSVEIGFQPAVRLEVESLGDSGGVEAYVIKTRQIPDVGVLDMSSTWPGVTMFLDAYSEGDFRVDGRLLFPYLDPLTSTWNQGDEAFTLFDGATDGREYVADDPDTPEHERLVEFFVGVDDLDLTVGGFDLFDVEATGFPIGDWFDGLDVPGGDILEPPLELSSAFFTRPGTPVEFGFVIAEFGLATPAMGTPVRTDPKYEGEFESEVALGDGATSNTFIEHRLTAGERRGFRLFVLNGGLKDPDVARVDFDIDGILAWTTQQPVGGVKASIPSPVPLIDAASVSAGLIDEDLGTIFSFEERLRFDPRLAVDLHFSRPTEVETGPGSGTFERVSVKRVRVGRDIQFHHPGGRLTIDPVYTLDENLFTNDTDLVGAVTVEAEILSWQLKILGVPKTLLPKFSLLTFDSGLADVAKFKVVDVNFHDDEEEAAFPLAGFQDVPGSRLVVHGSNEAPQALCGGVTLELDQNGVASLAAPDLDGGSSDPDPDDVLSFEAERTQFGCSDLGDQSIALTVSDQDGATDTCTATVTVRDTLPPAGPDRLSYTGTEGEVVAFDSAGVADNCGVVDLVWTFPDGTLSSETNPGHVFDDDGVYSVALALTDGESNAATATVEAVISNAAPVVMPLADRTIYSGDTLSVTASFTDPGVVDTHGATFDWGDGESADGLVEETGGVGTASASRVYYEPGTYTVAVNVLDDDGGVGGGSFNLTVEALPIEIDLRPFSWRNVVNTRSRGFSVAILSTAGEFGSLAARDVDAGTVRLDPGSAPGRRWRGSLRFDVNRDGRRDLVLRFRTRDTELQPGVERVVVSGRTTDGRYFEGADRVRVIDRRWGRRPGRRSWRR